MDRSKWSMKHGVDSLEDVVDMVEESEKERFCSSFFKNKLLSVARVKRLRIG